MKLIEYNKTCPEFFMDEGTGNTILLCASSKRGKSTLMKCIYDKYYLKNNKIIPILISPSSHIGIFDKLPPKVIKINKFNKDTVQLLNKLTLIQNRSSNAYEFLIMVDDCIDVRYNKILNNLILVLRNSNFSTIVSIQYDKILIKQARSSVNNIVCGGLNTDDSIESILKSFLKSAFIKEFGTTQMSDLVECYRELTDSNNGHSFLKYHPQSRDLELFTLII